MTEWPVCPRSSRAARSAIAHLDIDRAEINKVKHVQWSHVGLLGEALSALTEHGRRTGFKRDYGEWHARSRSSSAYTPWAMTARARSFSRTT